MYLGCSLLSLGLVFWRITQLWNIICWESWRTATWKSFQSTAELLQVLYQGTLHLLLKHQLDLDVNHPNVMFNLPRVVIVIRSVGWCKEYVSCFLRLGWIVLCVFIFIQWYSIVFWCCLGFLLLNQLQLSPAKSSVTFSPSNPSSCRTISVKKTKSTQKPPNHAL